VILVLAGCTPGGHHDAEPSHATAVHPGVDSSEAPCATGFAANGVCCNTACDGVCEACVQALTSSPSGLCAPVLEGTDPKRGCPGDSTCDGKGGCWNTALGGACVKDAECQSGHCVDGTCCDAACSGACERCDRVGAVGRCTRVRGGEEPATCNATIAGGACTEAPCRCDAEGVCRPSAARVCDNGGTCASGVCLDGVCCEAACHGPCLSCNGAYTGQESGVCAPVLAGYDPAGVCGAAASDGPRRCFPGARGGACTDDYV
jgi:hypothetical protein